MLRTNNFFLRPMSAPEDATGRYLEWIHDPEIYQTLMVDGPNQTIDSLIDYINGHDNQNSFLFGIYAHNGLHIGTHSFRYSERRRCATVGVMIGDKDYWGKGVPLETRAKILDWAFDAFDCRKVEAGCFSNNVPALFNFLKQKWVREGILRASWLIGEEEVDLILFGMFKEEWDEIRGA